MEDSAVQQVKIERPLYEQEKLHKDFEYQKHKTCAWKRIAAQFSNTKPKKCLFTTIPALGWLKKYSWKTDFVSDVIAGITVAIMHIPQGMAYGMLGNVPPVVGIYMAVFPVLIYFFLGTSRHNSMGTFAVVCLMTGKTVLEHSHTPYFSDQDGSNTTADDVMVTTSQHFYSPIEVATAVTFVVAIFQLTMYIFRLGIVSVLLSDTLVSGFTTGAAMHVLTSQIKDLLGLDIPKHKGYFVIINTYKSIFEEISNFNHAATIVSAVTIIISSLNNELLKPALTKKCIFPMPIELLAIVIGTLVSKYFYLPEIYDIQVVGEIPVGLPQLTAPPFGLLWDVALDGLTIAIVSYTVSMSMALIFAQRLNYKVNANQELLAQGAGNIVGSFFSCMPFTASLSRSMIQQTVGGKTQLASIVSCGILIVMLMWIGPFFEPLPKAVLASVIVVALKGMLMQVTSFVRFWRLSKMDAAVWMVTFLTVVFIGIDIGLLIGVMMSLITIFALGFKPYTCLLGSIPHTDLYLDITRYKGTVQIPGIKIFHYCGGINFASRNYFKSELYRLVGFHPQHELALRKKLAKIADDEKFTVTNSCPPQGKTKKYAKMQKKLNANFKCLVLDFSALSYIDPSGIGTLKIIAEDFQRIDVPIYIAGCSAPVYEMMAKCDLINASNNSIRVFPTIHDAVQCACGSNIQILQDDSVRKYSKRETAKNKKNVNDGITNEKVDELKSSLTELQSNSESTNIENVEEKIQGILEDMGLVDDSSSAMEPVKAKRNEDSSESSIEEDEDLDRGSNRIALTRDKHSTKTENAQSASENKEGDSSIKTRESTASTQKPESSNEKRSNIPDAHAEAVRVANYQAEGEEFIRTKREREKSSAEKASESEGLMKGLEKAGELTVSGNKSPLASSGNGVTNQKRKTDVISDEEKEMEEEARLERNIQAKIDAIKEEAKREISNLQTTTECGQGKRASNLLEQESEQVDPERSPENSALEPHVRKRRKRSTQERDANEEKQNNLSEENSKNINNQNSREREQELLDNKVKTDEKRQTANENFHASSENGYESENVANLAVAQYNQNDRLENEQDADEMPRRRRQTFDDYYGNERSKRAQSFDDYMPYRDEDEEIDDETDELDDDSFDDRTAALAETRMEDSGVYEPEAPLSDDVGYEEYSQHSKRSRSISPNYYAEWSQAQGPSITNYQYETDPRYVRRKRQNFNQLAALHGGSAVRSHLNAVRLRNMPVRDVKRQKRQRVMEERPQQLSDMSDTDLFGPLPQSYEGELARYKRVKRRTRPKQKLS